MPQPHGDEVLSKLEELHLKYPELRICQIIGNAVPHEEAVRLNNDLYYVENHQLLAWLMEYDRRVTEQASQAAAERPSESPDIPR